MSQPLLGNNSVEFSQRVRETYKKFMPMTNNLLISKPKTDMFNEDCDSWDSGSVSMSGYYTEV